MTTTAEANPQISLYETVLDDPAIEALLEDRAKKKDSAKAVSKRARDADAAAKVALEGLDLGEGAPVRVGRFVITLKRVASRNVSFETAPGERLSIRADKEPS